MGYTEFHDKQSITADDLNFAGESFQDTVLSRTKALTNGIDSYNNIPCDAYNLTNLKVSGNYTSNLTISAGYAIDSDGELLYSDTTIVSVLPFMIKGNGTYYVYVDYAEITVDTKITDEGKIVVVETTDGISYTYADIGGVIKFTIVPQSEPLSAPWVLLASIIWQGNVVVFVTDLRSNSPMETTATDLGTYIHPSGSLSWETNMYQHVVGADPSGSVSATNPHGVPILTRWDDVTNKPFYLIGGIHHGNGYGQGTWDGGINSRSSHQQNYLTLGPTEQTSGSVRVSRWGTCSNFSVAYPTDTQDVNYPFPNPDYPFPSSNQYYYPVSYPTRHGGISIYLDFNKIEQNNFVIDATVDWRKRWVNIQGMYHWWKGDKSPRDETTSSSVGLAAVMWDYSGHWYLNHVAMGTVEPILVTEPGDTGSVLVAAFGYTCNGIAQAAEHSITEYRGVIPIVGKIIGNPLFIYADVDTGYLYGYMKNLRIMQDVQLPTGAFVLANIYPHGALRISAGPQAMPTAVTYFPISNDAVGDGPITSNSNSGNITVAQLLQYAIWINQKYSYMISGEQLGNLRTLINVTKQLPNPKNLKTNIAIDPVLTVFSYTEATIILGQFSKNGGKQSLQNAPIGAYLSEAIAAGGISNTTPQTTPATVLNVTYFDITGTPNNSRHKMFILSWSPAYGAQAYILDESKDNKFSPETTTTYTVHDGEKKVFDYRLLIKTDTTYYYRIKANYPNGSVGTYSNILPVRMGFIK